MKSDLISNHLTISTDTAQIRCLCWRGLDYLWTGWRGLCLACAVNLQPISSKGYGIILKRQSIRSAGSIYETAVVYSDTVVREQPRYTLLIKSLGFYFIYNYYFFFAIFAFIKTVQSASRDSNPGYLKSSAYVDTLPTRLLVLTIISFLYFI